MVDRGGGGSAPVADAQPEATSRIGGGGPDAPSQAKGRVILEVRKIVADGRGKIGESHPEAAVKDRGAVGVIGLPDQHSVHILIQ